MRSQQKSLQCTICLELMTDPSKTRCGHSFCRCCIGKVLQSKDAHCPLCKKSLNRRNISRDDDMQIYIEKFNKLVTAIEMDTHIDILWHSKRPRDTKESSSYPNAGQSSQEGNKEKPSEKERSACRLRQNANRQTRIDRPSTSRVTRIEYNKSDEDSDVSIGTFNPPFESTVSLEKTETLSSLSRALPDDDETRVTSDIKIRTWLHSVPDKSDSDTLMTDEENEAPSIGDRAKPTNPISVDDAGKSNEIGEVYRDRRIDAASRRPRRDRKPSADCPERVDDEDATSSQVNKGARQIGEVIEIDSDEEKRKWKYKSHARIPAMESREKNARSRSVIDLKAVNQSGSSSSAAHGQEHRAATSTSCSDRASTSAITEQATADWSRVIEFGKEMKRARKRKVKKLNVSVEKTKISPRIVENIVLVPGSRYDSAGIVSCNKKSENVANLSNRPGSDGRDAIDESLDLSDAAKAEASSETNIRMEFVDEDKDESSKSCPMMSTSYVTLEEGRQIRIINLNNEQVNKILGLESAAEDSQNRRCHEDNAADHRDSPLSRQKRLSVLTPEKLNESVHEREVIRDVSSQTSVGNFGSSSRLSAEKRPTPGPREASNVRGTSSGAASSPLQFSTPGQSRLSLRRKLEIGSGAASPRLSDLPLSTRLSIAKHEERRSVDSPVLKDDERFERLKAVRRDLKFKITHEDQQRTCRDAVPASASKSVIEAEDNDGNVSGIDRQDSEPGRDLTGETSTVPPKKSPPTRSESVAGRERLMKIIRLGSLIREHLPSVRYIYLGTTNRESSIPAKVEISTVYNILQSTGVSEVRVATSDPLNDSQDSCNIVVENTCFASETASRGTASKEFPAALPIRGASATSTPRKDVDSHLSLQSKNATTVRFLTDASQRTDKSRIVENVASERGARSLPSASSRADKSAIHGSTISHTHPGTSNSIKLLSPDKDSQLKFLQIDSPSVSEREQLRHASSIKSVIKGNNFPEIKSSRLAASTVGKAREPSVKSSGKNRKRMRSAGDRELFKDRSSDGNENSSDSDSSRTTIKFGRYKELLSKSASWSRLDANKKRRLSSPDDRDVEVIPSTSKKPDAPERKLETSNSDTKSKPATHITKSLERHIDHRCGQMQHPPITDNLESDRQCDRMQRKASITDVAAKEDPAERRSDHQCARMQRNASITDAAAKQGPAERDSEDRHIWNIIDRWTNEHNATAQKRSTQEGKNSQSSVKSMRSAPEESSASHQSSHSRNAPSEMEKRKNSKSSQKSSARDPDMFESSSFFDSENVDYILRQSTTRPKEDTSKRIEDSTNDDIINRVLEIDRSRGNTDACRPPPDSVPRNNITSQREKDNGEHLLQDNFDEIIASVEQPQSEDFIPCTEQPDRNPNRPSAKQKTSNCLAMADESCGVMQEETPIVPPSSTNDMFEHYSPRNITKLPHETTNAIARSQDSFISRSSDKENVACSQKRHGHAGDQRDGKDAAANVDAIDKDSRKRVVSRHNVSREKEKTSFEERNTLIQSAGRLRVDDADGETQRATAAGNESNPKDDTFEHDSLMNITQHQMQLQMFEEDLFSVAVQNRTKTKMISQDDSFRKEQSTPGKRKQNNQDKNTESEERSADEDDVVENTPERKRRNSGNTVKTNESRESTKIPFLSPISRISDRTPRSACQIVHPFVRSDASTPSFAMRPHSTPITHNPVVVLSHADVLRASKRSELAENSSGVLLAKQVDARTLENVRRPPDRRNLRFVCSGLTAAQIATVKEFAAKHNANYVNQFDRDVTHVIVKTAGEQNAAKSTLKYLQGIAHRKWIVSYRWIEDCGRQQRLLDELPYEATSQNDVGTNGAGPRNSRLRDKGLFEGFTFLCVGPYDNVSPSQYQDLLLATGASVVDSFDVLAKMGGIKGIVIQDKTHDDKAIKHWYRTAKAAPILVDWIVECIGHYKLFKLTPYIIHLSPQDFCAIGYPQELVEEDEEYSDDE